MGKPILALLLTTVTIGSCGAMDPDAGITTETRDLPPFSSIALNGVGTLRIHQGPQSVRVTMDGALIDRFETVVKDGKLSMGFERGFGFSYWRAMRRLRRCDIDVTVPELRVVELNGAGTISADPTEYGALSLSVNGAGTVELRGTADAFSVRCTGAARVLARDLAAASARVGVTGAGEVELRAEDELDAAVTGAGSIAYWGSPRVSERVSGAGSIRRAGD